MFPSERPPPYRRELQQISEVIQQASQMVRDDPEAAVWYCEEAQRMTAGWSRKWTPVFGRNAATDPAARLFSEDAAVAEAETPRGLAQAERSLGKPQSAMKRVKKALSLLEGRETRRCRSSRSALRLVQAELLCDLDAFPAAIKIYQQAQVEATNAQQWELAAAAYVYEAHAWIGQTNRAAFQRCMATALQLADDHDLKAIAKHIRQELASWQIDWDATGEILGTLSSAQQRRVISADDVGFHFMTAEYLRAHGDNVSADLYMTRAANLLKGGWERKYHFLTMWASQLQKANQVREGFAIASEAFRLADDHGRPDLAWEAWIEFLPILAESEDPEQENLLDEWMEQLRGQVSDYAFAKALLRRSAAYARRGKLSRALADCEDVKRTTSASDLLAFAHMICSEVREGMDQPEQALRETIDAIGLSTRQAATGSETQLAQWKDALNNAVQMYANAARLSVRLGRAREAFAFAEQGKAMRLRAVSAGSAGTPQPAARETNPIDLDTLRKMLAPDAALVMFAVSLHKTLMLVVRPEQIAPDGVIVPLGSVELEGLLPAVEIGTRNPWDANQLETLAEAYLPPLREVVDRYYMLYLVPDAQLYFVPFAALRFPDGSRLVEHCALASVPSATVLRWCRSRPQPEHGHTCLAVGVGEVQDEQGEAIRFADQAKALVTGHPWAEPPRLLLDDEATIGRFLADAPAASVIHLSCHGLMDSTAPRSLSASQLRFSDGRISALEISERGTWLHSDLVFLNACMSGGFHSRVASEAGGFWEAFLGAGAASLIATLGYVDPRAAERLARGFYYHWLEGRSTKAEALRQSQLDMLRNGAPPQEWASHILIGSHQ